MRDALPFRMACLSEVVTNARRGISVRYLSSSNSFPFSNKDDDKLINEEDLRAL